MPEPAITEDANMDRIAQLARPLGWVMKHDRKGRTKDSWRTPVMYDGRGWPDLFMVHPATGDCLARELKRWGSRNDLGPGQANWIDWLGVVPGIDVGRDEPRRDQPLGIWTERDWDTIIVPRILRHTHARIAAL